MKILAIDTSGAECGVAIIEDNNSIANFTLSTGTTHSQNLVPLIEQTQKFTNLDLKDFDALACSIGPGSFTGLRIGIATIKGFALSLNKPVIGVPTLLSIAYNVSNYDGLICSVLDARNNNVYAALYFKENNKISLIGSYIADDISILLNTLNEYTDKKDILFVGDGVEIFKETFIQNLKGFSNLIFSPSYINSHSALSVARAAYDMALNNEYQDYHSLTPLYLKKSQAERELENNGKH